MTKVNIGSAKSLKILKSIIAQPGLYEKYYKAWRKNNRAMGLCDVCTEKRGKGDDWYCPKHRLQWQQRRKIYKLKRKARGLCASCPKKSGPINKDFCEYHRVKNAAAVAFRKKRYIISK